VLVLDDDAPSAAHFVTIAVLAVLYVGTKHSARQMVPPDNVAAVSARWRPLAPSVPTTAPGSTSTR
jgi:hypothetical protein